MAHTTPPPYLELEERLNYLVARGNLASAEQCSPKVREHLTRTNFHFFMGYLRNYYARGGTGPLDDVVDICLLDAQVSTAAFKGIREVEHGLRHQYVEAYCALGLDPCEYYLLDSSYGVRSQNETPLASSIRNQVLRAREPYIEDNVSQACATHQIHGASLKEAPITTQIQALGTLPIWATIDWWSLGTLSRSVPALILPAGREDGSLLKSLAERLEIKSNVFARQLESICVLRNLVAHHSRLWARPAAATPPFPRLYGQEKKQTHPQSGYVALLTLASFHHGLYKTHALKDELESLVDSNTHYSAGMRRIR